MMTTPHHLALTFDSWFPFDESDDEEMREMYRDGFVFFASANSRNLQTKMANLASPFWRNLQAAPAGGA